MARTLAKCTRRVIFKNHYFVIRMIWLVIYGEYRKILLSLFVDYYYRNIRTIEINNKIVENLK